MTIILTPTQQKDLLELATGDLKRQFATLFGKTIALDENYKCTKILFNSLVYELIVKEGLDKKHIIKICPEYFSYQDLKKDTLVYVTNDTIWEMRYFSHFKDDKIYCFKAQNKSEDENHTTLWDMWSLANPLLK